MTHLKKASNIYYLLLVFGFLYPKESISQTKINAITANRSPIIGSAYLSEKESFIGQTCVKGDVVPAGIAQSTFNFSQSLSKKQAEDELGFL
jgi:hypothetical protein